MVVKEPGFILEILRFAWGLAAVCQLTGGIRAVASFVLLSVLMKSAQYFVKGESFRFCVVKDSDSRSFTVSGLSGSSLALPCLNDQHVPLRCWK